MFEGFSTTDLKVVLDRQPLLGTGPLSDWLRNQARGRWSPMVALDNFRDNLCLWRCIVVHLGSRPDRSTNAARLLARNYFRTQDIPGTALRDLGSVEQHLNRGNPVSEWIGFRVYEPERQQDETIVWRLARLPPARV